MSQERHLSEAQISAYLSAGPDVSLETNSGTESHLEECESCRNRALEMHREQMGFRKAGRMTRDCPEDEILQLVAAGGSEPAIAATTMDHAARCSYCGPRLKKLANIFSRDLSPEQQKIMAQLQTSKPEWQREFIRDYVKPRRSLSSDRPGLWAQIFGTWWGRAAMAGATAAIVLAAVFEGPVLSAKYELHRAQGLVSAAYGECRTTETRFSGAPSADYKPYPTVLGPDDERGLDVNRPELMKAEGTVADKVKGQDPRWLQLQGRISLLEATPKSIAQAQKYFEDAQRKGLNTPSLKIDLASSYYEHDVRAEYPNLQRTLDLLLEVLHQPNLSREDKAAALFDLGIAYEKTQAWDLAASTWEDYLKVDSSGAWAEQARDRLKKAKEKIPAPKPQGYNQPIFFLGHLSQLKPEDPEEYQAIALSQWLPAALEHNDAHAREAVSKLADVLATQHSDPWLKDFSSALKPQDLLALRLLNQAVQANADGLYENANKISLGAAKAFAKQTNLAGEIRSRLESAYSLRSLLQGHDCLRGTEALQRRLKGKQYRWIQAQLLIEEAECNTYVGALGESEVNTRASFSAARNSHFPVLQLRITGIAASLMRQQGKCDQSWSKAVEGLTFYWSGEYPPERLDQFYASVFQCAEKGRSPYVAAAFLHQILSIRGSELNKNLIREGLLHLELGNILATLRENDEATQETRRAALLLDNAAEAYPKRYRLVANFSPAQRQLQQEQAEKALKTLLHMQGLVESTQDQMIALSYYRLLGTIYLRLNRLEESNAAYQAAIKIAEGSLDHLKAAADRASWWRATDDSYRGVVRVLLARGQTAEALSRWEAYQTRTLARQTSADGPYLTERESSQKNGSITLPQVTRVVYAIFEDGIQIWLIKGGLVHGKWVAIDREQFLQAEHKFAEECATADSSLEGIHEDGARLFLLLLSPVVDDLSERSVVFELDSSIYNLPMEALRSPAGWYFGEKYALTYSPGLLIERELRSPTQISAKDSLLFLDASRSPEAGYLPGVEAERKTAATLFPKADFVDTSVAKEQDWRTGLEASEIVIYVGHGQTTGNGTELLLNKNRSLKASEITPDLLKRSQLVVLSACATGRGEKAGLLDIDSLVHSFLNAGVPAVVSTHWNVDSASSSKLMSSFYKHLVTDKTIGQAMYNARLEALHANGHPYYWAGFSLAGRAD